MSWFSDFVNNVVLPVAAVAILGPLAGTALLGDAVAAGTVSALTATAVGAGVVSGGITALKGGSPSDILKSAVLSGAGAYIGGTIAEKLTGSGVPKAAIDLANKSSDPIAALNASQGWTLADIPYLQTVGASSSIIDTAIINNQKLFGVAPTPEDLSVQNFAKLPNEQQAALINAGVDPTDLVKSSTGKLDYIAADGSKHWIGQTWNQQIVDAGYVYDADGNQILANQAIVDKAMLKGYPPDSQVIHWPDGGTTIEGPGAAFGDARNLASAGQPVPQQLIDLAHQNMIAVKDAAGNELWYDPNTEQTFDSTMKWVESGKPVAGAPSPLTAAAETPYKVDVSGTAHFAESPPPAGTQLPVGHELATLSQVNAGTAMWDSESSSWVVPSPEAPVVAPPAPAEVPASPVDTAPAIPVVPPAAPSAPTTISTNPGGSYAPGGSNYVPTVTVPETPPVTNPPVVTQPPVVEPAVPIVPPVNPVTQPAVTQPVTPSQSVTTPIETTTLPPGPIPTTTVSNNPGGSYAPGGSNYVPTVTVPETPPVVTQPPVVEPAVPVVPPVNPVINPPVVTQPPVTNPPVTQPPVTNPPVTNPPVTQPPDTYDYTNPGKYSDLINGTNIGVGVGAVALPKIVEGMTTPAQNNIHTWSKLPPLTWGKTQSLVNPGVNPGWVQATPYYQTNNPVQAQYEWGNHPYAGTEADLANYNNMPNAPVSPWGVQQGPQPFDVQGFIRNMLSPTQQAALSSTIPQYNIRPAGTTSYGGVTPVAP